jgi:hypothetical protein
VQLDAAVVAAGPEVEQPAAQLGVPHQRRHVVEHDGHPDVVHRAVGHRADSLVGDGAATEQPHVTGAGQVDGLVQGQRGARHRSSGGRVRMKLWKALGLAGLAGVATTGAIIARNQRARTQLTPEEIRDRLHRRLAEADAADRQDDSTASNARA